MTASPDSPGLAGPPGLETLVRSSLASVIDTGTPAAELDPDVDLADGYGLTSLNKVLFLTGVCDDAQVDLAVFTEPDVAAMRTLRDVVTALGQHAGSAA